MNKNKFNEEMEKSIEATKMQNAEIKGEKEPEQEIVNEPIGNTPFRLIKNKNGWAAVLNNHLITPWKETPEEVQEHLDINNWEVLGVLIGVIVNYKIADLEKRLKEEYTTLRHNSI